MPADYRRRKYDIHLPPRVLAEQLLTSYGLGSADITAKRFAAIAQTNQRFTDATVWRRVYRVLANPNVARRLAPRRRVSR